MKIPKPVQQTANKILNNVKIDLKAKGSSTGYYHIDNPVYYNNEPTRL